MARWILDTCKTTREAVEYLETMPKVWGETYIVIDKENTIAKVEVQSSVISYWGHQFNPFEKKREKRISVKDLKHRPNSASRSDM